MSRLPDLDEFLEDDEAESPGDDWDWGYLSGKRDRQEQIINIVNRYKNKPAFTFDNLISVIEKDWKPDESQ